MQNFALDLRQAWRSLRRRQAYFATCAVTLTLVIAANAAIFAVVNATMLRPMPFATAGEVVHLFAQPPGTTATLQRNPLQQMEVSRLRERARSLARLEGFYVSERVITLGGEPSVAQGGAVTPGLLPMMAAPMAVGRTFAATEGEPGHFVAIVTHGYWTQTLGGGDVLGTTLVIDGQPHAVVGVLARSFAVPFLDVSVFTPLVASAEPRPRSPALTVVGLAELAEGVTIAQARDELSAISGQFAREFPRTHQHWTLGVQSAREWHYGSMRTPLLMLLVATALVLLIACANVASLTSAQVLARSGELSMRMALGASTADLLRLHLAELLVIGAAGLRPGLLLAAAAVPALLVVNPTIASTIGPVAIDWRVQAFSVLIATAAAILSAALPVARALRVTTTDLMAASNRTTGSRAAMRAQRALVSSEVALCVALLMASAVVIQGLRDLSRRSPGYQASGVLTAQIRLPEASYRTPESRATVVQRLLDDIGALPGVTSVGITQNAFIPKFSYQTLITVKDRPTPDEQPHTVQYRRVSPDYFRTMRIRVLSGRVFTASDTADRPPVAVVSRRFVEALMPRLDPVGQALLRNNPPPVTVIGVVDDVADVSVAESPEPTFYVAWAQNNNFGVPIAFVIRTAVEPASIVPAVRATVKDVDPSLPLRKAQPLEVFVTESTAPDRFRALVLGILAGLGLVLAAVGIAGVTYRSVVDRRRDFAVRLALGSAPARMVRLVLTESGRDLAIGTAAGIAGGVALCELLTGLLENVAPMDAATAALACVLIGAVGVLASLLPALGVLRVEAAQVLRS
jgi:putative ABC transport system permease protein